MIEGPILRSLLLSCLTITLTRMGGYKSTTEDVDHDYPQ